MSDDRASESLAYYASHGPITDPALHAAAFVGLPADIRALTRAVQGLCPSWIGRPRVVNLLKVDPSTSQPDGYSQWQPRTEIRTQC